MGINNNMEADDNVNNTISRRRFVTRLSVSARVVKHSEDDTINIIPVKLCYKKNRSPIGNGRFGTVTAGKILSVCTKNGNIIQLKSDEVAVKTLVLRPASLKEVSILQKLSHAHIVQLLAHHKNDRELHLIFERLNFTLYDKLDHDGPFHIDDCLGLSIQLFKALDYLESEFIIHRDIKPTNILLNESGRSLKLCDFGCAREVSNFEDKYASYMCSRFYRAPELLLGIEVYDFKVDIWSAACVIAEMLCAKPIFQGSSSVDQLVEIVSVIGLMTTSDFEGLGIDESYALADVITKQNFSPRTSTESTFAERIQAHLGL